MSDRVRVFLAGLNRGDLDALRERWSGNPGVEVAGAALLGDLQRGRVAVPDSIDAVLLSPAALPGPSRAREVAEPGTIETLTERERDVLALVADGRANRDIAIRLGISEHTVKFHLASIFGKLGVSSRTQAVRRGLKLGLIDI